MAISSKFLVVCECASVRVYGSDDPIHFDLSVCRTSVFGSFDELEWDLMIVCARVCVGMKDWAVSALCYQLLC